MAGGRIRIVCDMKQSFEETFGRQGAGCRRIKIVCKIEEILSSEFEL
jgi:hypothetical protein